MPTQRPRYQVTDTGRVATLLDRAAAAWPEVSNDRKQLLLRLAETGAEHLPAPTQALDAQSLEYVGKWVAIADDRVIFAAESAGDVVRWLRRHRRRADQLYRVPRSEADIVSEHGLS
jgi:hypothetical protein